MSVKGRPENVTLSVISHVLLVRTGYSNPGVLLCHCCGIQPFVILAEEEALYRLCSAVRRSRRSSTRDYVKQAAQLGPAFLTAG